MARICLVIPTLNMGGAERVISLLANEWSKKHNVTILLYNKENMFYSISEDVKTVSLDFSLQGKSLTQKVASSISAFVNMRTFLKRNTFDFVLSFMNKYNVFCLLASTALGHRIIVSERDGPSEKIKFITEKLRNITYGYAAGVICQTNASGSFIKEQTGNNNVKVIHNPISNYSVNNKYGSEQILNVARLVDKKGHRFLLEAFSLIRNRGNWRLAILGDGPNKTSLIKLAEELEISDSVDFVGAVNDLEPWFKCSSIFAFSSILEGFPNALAEAMSAGLPAVSFDCDAGPKDLILDGYNGYLVDVGDIYELSQRLQFLIDNSGERSRLGSNASKINKRLSVKNISNDYLDFCLGEK